MDQLNLKLYLQLYSLFRQSQKSADFCFDLWTYSLISNNSYQVDPCINKF